MESGECDQDPVRTAWDPLQECRVPMQWKGKQGASATLNSRIQEPCLYTFGTVNDRSWGTRKLQGKCFPEESFSTVGRAECPRGGMEGKVGGVGLWNCK